MNNTVNVDQFMRENAIREEKLRRTRLLTRAIVDAGFKTLARDLHPDHGGDAEAMAYLNEAHRVMKLAATEKLSSSTLFGESRRECMKCGHYFAPYKRKCRSAECMNKDQSADQQRSVMTEKQRAYHRLAKVLHPNTGNGNEALMKDLNKLVE